MQKDERHALQEFAALEFQLNSAEEIRLQQHLDTLKQDMHVSATELASLQSRLCDREASVQMKTAEVGHFATPELRRHAFPFDGVHSGSCASRPICAQV